MRVYLDTNFIISLIVKTELSRRAIKISSSILEDADLFVGMNVIEETLYVLMRITKKPLKEVVEKLESFIENMEILVLEYLPYKEMIEVCKKYSLLPNDALIVASCKYFDIKKIATFDTDFENVDFLEIIN